MTTIVTNDHSTDDRIIDLLAGYCVRANDTDMLVTGSGRDSRGYMTIEGLLWADDDGGPAQPHVKVSIPWDDAEIEVY